MRSAYDAHPGDWTATAQCAEVPALPAMSYQATQPDMLRSAAMALAAARITSIRCSESYY